MYRYLLPLDGGATPHQTPVECSQGENLCGDMRMLLSNFQSLCVFEFCFRCVESSITDSLGRMTENSAEKRSLAEHSPEGDSSRSYKGEGVAENSGILSFRCLYKDFYPAFIAEEEPSCKETSQEKTEVSSKRKKSAEEGLSASKIAKVSDADAGTSGEHSGIFSCRTFAKLAFSLSKISRSGLRSWASSSTMTNLLKTALTT